MPRKYWKNNDTISADDLNELEELKDSKQEKLENGVNLKWLGAKDNSLLGADVATYPLAGVGEQETTSMGTAGITYLSRNKYLTTSSTGAYSTYRNTTNPFNYNNYILTSKMIITAATKNNGPAFRESGFHMLDIASARASTNNTKYPIYQYSTNLNSGERFYRVGIVEKNTDSAAATWGDWIKVDNGGENVILNAKQLITGTKIIGAENAFPLDPTLRIANSDGIGIGDYKGENQYLRFWNLDDVGSNCLNIGPALAGNGDKEKRFFTLGEVIPFDRICAKNFGRSYKDYSINCTAGHSTMKFHYWEVGNVLIGIYKIAAFTDSPLTYALPVSFGENGVVVDGVFGDIGANNTGAKVTNEKLEIMESISGTQSHAGIIIAIK